MNASDFKPSIYNVSLLGPLEFIYRQHRKKVDIFSGPLTGKVSRKEFFSDFFFPFDPTMLSYPAPLDSVTSPLTDTRK